MRKVTAGLFITLDGVTESPYLWQFDNFDADMMEILTAYLAVEDTILLGRVTYVDWAGYWPTSTDEPYASHSNNTPKYVFSKTLDKLTWQNSTLVKGSAAEEINRLKQLPGKNIGVAGSPTLVRSLMQDGIIDELTLMIHPVVAGKGKRLFQDGSELKRFKLVHSQITRTGVAVLTYQPLNR